MGVEIMEKLEDYAIIEIKNILWQIDRIMQMIDSLKKELTGSQQMKLHKIQLRLMNLRAYVDRRYGNG